MRSGLLVIARSASNASKDLEARVPEGVNVNDLDEFESPAADDLGQTGCRWRTFSEC